MKGLPLLLAVLLVGNGALARETRGQGGWMVTNLHPAGANESQVTGGYGAMASGGGQVPARQTGNAVFGSQRRAGTWSGTADSWTSLHPAGATNSSAFGGAAGPGGPNGAGGIQVGYAFVSASQSASLWRGTAGSWVNLNPSGSTTSIAWSADGDQQVGYTSLGPALWRGTAAPHVRLSPTVAGVRLSGRALDIHGGKQVGYVIMPTDASEHASLWAGTPGSWIDLNPAGASASNAWGVGGAGGQEQVGWSRSNGTRRACLWRGSAGSWVDLAPSDAVSSIAISTTGSWQAGAVTFVDYPRASVWNGTAASRVDLHSLIPGSWRQSTAERVWMDGDTICVGGSGFNMTTGRYEALLWRRSLAQPCPADVNADGFLDFFDYSDFVSCFESGSCAPGATADFNRDGFVDFFDYDEFVAAFEAGC